MHLSIYGDIETFLKASNNHVINDLQKNRRASKKWKTLYI